MNWQDGILLGLGIVVLGPLVLYAVIMGFAMVFGLGHHMAGGLWSGMAGRRKLHRILKKMEARDQAKP